MLRIGWFSTGAGEGSQRQRLLTAAVDAIRQRELAAEIAFVFCNRERGEHEGTDSFLDLVDSFGIRCLTLSSRAFRRARGGALSQPGQPLPAWRAEYDREVAELVGGYPFDVGVLAGYMLIFSADMAARYPFLNLHPAAPDGPVGTWQDVIWTLIERRADQSGVMVHLTTEELDRGPAVAYCTYSLRGQAFDSLWRAAGSRTAEELRGGEGEQHPLFREIRRHGVAREEPLVMATLRAFADGGIRIDGGRLLDAAGSERGGGLDLTAEIDARVALSAPGT